MLYELAFLLILFLRMFCCCNYRCQNISSTARSAIARSRACDRNTSNPQSGSWLGREGENQKSGVGALGCLGLAMQGRSSFLGGPLGTLRRRSERRPAASPWSGACDCGVVGVTARPCTPLKHAGWACLGIHGSDGKSTLTDKVSG